MADAISQKSDFLWKLKSCHWQQILPVVYLDVTDSCHLFPRKCLPHTRVRKLIGFHSFKLNCVLWKTATGLHTNQKSHKCFSLRQVLYFIMQRKVLYASFLFHHAEYSKDKCHRSRIKKIYFQLLHHGHSSVKRVLF